MISSSQERNTSDLPSYLENSYSLVGTGLKKKKIFLLPASLDFSGFMASLSFSCVPSECFI